MEDARVHLALPYRDDKAVQVYRDRRYNLAMESDRD